MMLRLLPGLLLAALAVGCAHGPDDDDFDSDWEAPAFQTLPVRGMPKDTEMTRLLEPYRAEVDKWRLPIGQSAAPMEIFRRECALNTWVADAAREHASTVTGKPVDMVMLNAGGVRASMPGGEVSYYDIAQILPFENTLVVMDLAPANLESVMAAVAAQKGRTALSGFTIEADSEGKLISFKIGGEAPDPSRTYTFATVDFLAMGNGGFEVLKDLPHQNTNLLLRYAIADHVRAMTTRGEVITAPADYSRQTFGGLRVEEMKW